MKRSVFRMTILLWVIYSLRTFAFTDWATIVKPLATQVLRLEILQEGAEQPGICSGVVINAETGVLLTAAHCVDHPASAQISLTVNGRHADVARVNRLVDLAIVRFTPKGEKAIILAEDVPAAGAEVAVAGYSFGFEKVAVQFGRVVQPHNQETKMLLLDAPTIPGDSGGPVIDEQGRLIGIVSRVYYSGPSVLAAAVHLEAVKDFADGHLPKKP